MHYQCRGYGPMLEGWGRAIEVKAKRWRLEKKWNASVVFGDC